MTLNNNIDIFNVFIKLSTVFFQVFLIYGIYKLYKSFYKKRTWKLSLIGISIFTFESSMNIFNEFVTYSNHFDKYVHYYLEIIYFIGVLLFVLGTSYIFQDLLHLSYIDDLTKLYNKSYVTDMFEKKVLNALKNNENLSILFLDVNDFKIVNDTFGHEEGNLLLSNIAISIQEAVRLKDIVARYGGDEFICLLNEANKEEAIKILDRIQNSVNEKYAIHVSGGIACSPTDGKTIKDLIRVADKRMYDNKKFLKSS